MKRSRFDIVVTVGTIVYSKNRHTWIGRFELGRAYLEIGAFTEADSEYDRCIKRRGEALSLFLDPVPTYGYFPPVYFYQGRAREGMKSTGFAAHGAASVARCTVCVVRAQLQDACGRLAVGGARSGCRRHT